MSEDRDHRAEIGSPYYGWDVVQTSLLDALL
jgi:hypothetical protein